MPIVALLGNIFVALVLGLWHAQPAPPPEPPAPIVTAVTTTSALVYVPPVYIPTQAPPVYVPPVVVRTPTPTVAPALPTAPYAAVSSIDEALALSNWPPALWPTVRRLVQCESSGQTSAVGPYGHRGLLQVDPRLHGPVPTDAVGQLNQGYLVYLKQGWGAWECY